MKELNNILFMRLKKTYTSSIAGQLAKELKLKNLYQTPKLEKVIINVGCGEATTNKAAIGNATADLTAISGQKPVVTHARKSVAAFKIRKGQPLGVKVTLRGQKMYDFVEKLFKIVLPRIRDFRGIPETSFDGRGNLNIGIGDQTLFPEIEYDKIDKIRGLEITLVTSTNSDSHARLLFEKLGLVFKSIS